jgi:apolipoprotein D and lipocalin family protein
MSMQRMLRNLSWALVLAGGVVLAESPAVKSVAAVDLGRYAGRWYEIAAFPMFFQRRCVGDTTAEYTLRDDSAVGVRNRCRTEDGFDEANGRATVVEGTGNAQLEVSFFWPFRADYWVIGLADDYRWAVVGNPNRKYLWVLSRTPQLGREDLDRALAIAASQGYDLAQLKYTRQGSTTDTPGAAR